MNQKNKAQQRARAFLLVGVVLLFWNLMQHYTSANDRRIVCAGDSLTYGTGIENREENCYPVKLLDQLGTSHYKVGNFGVEGVSAGKDSVKPYTKEDRFTASQEYHADYVLLMLGTNDTQSPNWSDDETFSADYKAIVESYQKLSTKPRVILITPPALMVEDSRFQPELLARIQDIIVSIASEEELDIIDFYSISSGHPEWYAEDGIHLNAAGAEALAKEAFAHITNDTDKA